MPNRVRVDASDLRKVSLIAKEFGPQLQKQLRKQLRAAGKVGADAVKADIHKMPSGSSSPRHVSVSKRGQIVEKNLRDLIADAVTVNLATSGKRADLRIRIRKTPALQAIGAGGIAKAINTGRWRHPVYGNRNVWVSQTGIKFFDEPLNALKPEILVLVKKALDDAIAISKGRL